MRGGPGTPARLLVVLSITAATSGALAGARANFTAMHAPSYVHVATPYPAATTLSASAPSPAPPSPRPRRVLPAAAQAPRRALRTALIVGVDDADPSALALGAATDAGYLRTALLAHGFRDADVTVLVNGGATRGRVLAELNRLAARTAPDGLAVVGISTHATGSSFRTGDGLRVSVSELAARVGAIRARVWTVMAVCYAGRFAVPGITGHERIATLSSDANNLSYEKGSMGSDLFYYMVQLGMVQRAADGSVEDAFNYAHLQIAVEGTPLPVISDGATAEVVLGPRA